MSTIHPIPSGACLQAQWDANKPASAPVLPTSWTATVLLSPFGDLKPPLKNYSQLVVGHIESSWTPKESWLRARLYLTQDLTYFDFLFINQTDRVENCQWYWINSTPQGEVNNIYGPLPTTLRIPSPTFFSDRTQPGSPCPLRWGNKYPLMCTDTNPEGIHCDHWTDPQSWYAFRRHSGHLFRILTMNPLNPLGLPILGAYYLANVPTFRPHAVSEGSHELIHAIRKGAAQSVASYPNTMITQEQIQQAMADPLASARCTLPEIQRVLPGFIPKPDHVHLPRWTNGTYVEGWTLGSFDAIPYYTRVCYLWTGNDDSKQQTVCIGAGGGANTYLLREDASLNMKGGFLVGYQWQGDSWVESGMPTSTPKNVGIPYPDWIASSNGEVMGKINGNADFGLRSDEELNLIGVQSPGDGEEFSIFWVWFLKNGVGMLFSEGSFIGSTWHLQAIDYTLFVRDAPVTQGDFSGPFPAEPAAAKLRMDAEHSHLYRIHLRPRTTKVAPS